MYVQSLHTKVLNLKEKKNRHARRQRQHFMSDARTKTRNSFYATGQPHNKCLCSNYSGNLLNNLAILKRNAPECETFNLVLFADSSISERREKKLKRSNQWNEI